MQDNIKIKEARIPIAVAFVLTILKLLVGLIANSLAIISSAIDSLLDLVSSCINYFLIKKADEPADKSHPYGHGKIENVAGLFQVVLIAITGGSIIYEGIKRFGSDEHISTLTLGIFTMIFSSVVSFILSSRLGKAAAETESIALAAYSINFKADGYINLGVIISLILCMFTKNIIFDSVMSIFIGTAIIWSAVKLSFRSFEDLTDKELPPEILSEIESIIQGHSKNFLGYHNLRTRRAGSQKLIDLHLVACRNLHLDEIHNIADTIEKEIERKIHYSNVTIHAEPCRTDCTVKKYDKEKCIKKIKGILQ